MKKITAIMILLLLFTMIGCKKETRQELNNVQSIMKGLNNLEKNTKKLAATKPITKVTIKKWMPENIGDLKRTSYDIGNQIGASSVKLTYKGEDNKKINISILDGAGSGSSIVGMFSMFANADIDKENESGYERTTTFNKQRVLVKYQTATNYEKSAISYLLDERFGIEANGWDMKPKELWSYLEKLKINKLK